MRSKDQLDQMRRLAMTLTADKPAHSTAEALTIGISGIIACLVYVGDCIRAHADTMISTGSSIRHQPDQDPDEPQGAGV